MMIALSGAWSLTAVLLAAPAPDPPPLPRIDGREAVAVVNGVPITLDDFVSQLGQLHEEAMGAEHGDAGPSRPPQDPSAFLDRLVTIELIVQEARNIGLDALPEVRKLLDSYRMDLLKQVLFDRRTAGLQPAASDVEALYRSRVQEDRVQAIRFPTEASAKAFAETLAAGTDFEAAAAAAVASGAGTREEIQIRPGALVPEAAAALARLEPGQASPPVAIGEAWAVLRLVGHALPENPEARKKAGSDLARALRSEATEDYRDELRKKYTRADLDLLRSIDFEAEEPGFEALKKDGRVIATVEGEPPVTVGQLAERIQRKFFHGVEEKKGKGRLNAAREATLEEMLTNRAILIEAARQKIEETGEFRSQWREYEGGVLFGMFVKKAIEPDVKVGEPELAAYLEAHRDEFRSAEQLRLEAIGFTARRPAEEALARLAAGADLAWMKANAEGQVPQEAVPQAVEFPKHAFAAPALPEELRRAVAGARAGEYRLAEVDGQFWILAVRESVPSRPLTLEEARGALTARVAGEKTQKALEEWAGRLRAASEVKVFATGERLVELLRRRYGLGA